MHKNCKHSHGHSHSGKRADIWTNIATVGEGVSSFVSDAYWLASWFDVGAGFEPVALGLSYYAIAFGTVTALLSAGGAAYSHRALNTTHQTSKDIEKNTSKKHTHEDEEHEHEHHSHTDYKEPTEITPIKLHSHPYSLRWPQKLALVGDFISHTGDIAGPITFVVNLATQNKIPRWGKILTQCSSTLFGGFSSIANVRTCSKEMVKLNKETSLVSTDNNFIN